MPKAVKHFVQQSWLLIVAAFCFGLLIAGINNALSERIVFNKAQKIEREIRKLISDANSIEDVNSFNLDIGKGKTVESTIYKAVDDDGQIIGWAFNTVGAGFADKIEIIIAVDKNCENMAGFGVLFSNETPGFGDKIKNEFFQDQYKNSPVGTFELNKSGDDKKIDSEIIAISGATVSSEAVVKIINNSLGQIKEQLVEKGLIANGN